MRNRFLCGLIILCSIFLIGCSKIDVDIFSSEISEACYNYYLGETTGYTFTFMSGSRKNDYKLDGYHTENIEFGIITIIIPEDVEFVSATYKIYYGNKTFMGELEQNPFDSSLMADIGFVIKDLTQVSILLSMGSISKYVTLNSISSSFKINYMEALELFVNESVNELKDLVDNNKLNGEVYIKIKFNKEIDSNYYYLIRVLGRQGKSVTGIVNPVTCEILAVA